MCEIFEYFTDLSGRVQGSSGWTESPALQGYSVKESIKNRHGGVSPSAQAALQTQQNMAQQQAQMQMQMHHTHVHMQQMRM